MSKRTQRGMVFWLAIAVVGFVLLSAAIAISTSANCRDGVDQSWKVIPPKWECDS